MSKTAFICKSWVAILVCCVTCACNRSSVQPDLRHQAADSSSEPNAKTRLVLNGSTSVRTLVASEELLLKLTTKLHSLNESVLNLKLPDHQAASLFSDRINFQSLFDVAFTSMAYFDRSNFTLVRGEFLDDELTTFDSNLQFVGLGKSNSGNWRMMHATIDCQWQSPRPDDVNAWKIASWQIRNFEFRDAEQMMFREVLDQVLPPKLLQRARESRHWQLAQRHFYPQLRAKATGDDNRFFEISTANHPGVSVVDLDRDGFDDIYVTVRWGKNMLFRNDGDGTFDEIAADVGLDIEGRSNAAVFADFDNDGDYDAMIARSFERSLYFVNEGGRFVDHTSDWVSGSMPFQATSVSAADYNGDGLLDIYFSTYHQDSIQSRMDADLSHPDHRIHKYLTKEQSTELKRRHQNENRSFINQVGPPNVLLKNMGDGRFEVAPEQSSVAVWRNSFQSTWSDMDGDGDPDLYVANDFAPDHLLRNDGEAGFTDVSQAMGMNAIGFGMGVSWGDYDNNGTRDLYVSNMYSKAGLRITHQIDGLDPRIRQLSEGNYLYSNQGNQWRLVSGFSSKELAVSRAGWSWGGQFVDVNNDSFLDLYVPNGYYTAPEEFGTQVDL